MRKNRKSAVKLLLATIVLTATMGLTAYAEENPEIKAAVARAKAADAGSYQAQYVGGGWKIEKSNANGKEEIVRAIRDQSGMLISPTSGVIYKIQTPTISKEYYNAGSDRSIKLSTDPSNGNLQPNWIYNPLGKQMVAPPVICMDKNTYYSIGWTLTSTDYNTGITGRRMDTCDTAGSWVYNPNPTGSADYYGLGGQLSGWMYRYADGTYAANGDVYIYDGYASNTADNKGAHISGQAYLFNENGFLITNSGKSSTYVDEFGRECDGTAGPFRQSWYYKD